VRVLIVDDNAINRRILNEMCTIWGMQPDPAERGIVGLQMMRRARAAGNPYRLVLLDAQMPEMDGFEVASKIQKDSELSGAPIIESKSAVLVVATQARPKGPAIRGLEKATGSLQWLRVRP